MIGMESIYAYRPMISGFVLVKRVEIIEFLKRWHGVFTHALRMIQFRFYQGDSASLFFRIRLEP